MPLQGELNLAALKPALRETVLTIAELARSADGRALMVGGAVRDLLLGVESVKDVDVEVFGLEPARLQEMPWVKLDPKIATR